MAYGLACGYVVRRLRAATRSHKQEDTDPD